MAAKRLRVACAQSNFVVGDVLGNARRIESLIDCARDLDADFLLTPEMAISGYPPEDLLASDAFVAACEKSLRDLRTRLAGSKLTALVGAPWSVSPVAGDDGLQRHLANALVSLSTQGTELVYAKRHLPNYAVFDERRWFAAGDALGVLHPGGAASPPVGVAICEDVWVEHAISEFSTQPTGIRVLLVANASPYDIEKQGRREELLARLAEQHRMAIVYLNLVGGQDELVFDGASLVFDSEGELVYRAKSFAEDFFYVDIDLTEGHVACTIPRKRLTHDEEVWAALVTGIHDYVAKAGHHSVVVGLSGGVDSALVATLAVDALGKEAVWGVGMPGPFSSEGSITDAADLAQRLGIRFDVLPIVGPYDALLQVLRAPGAPFDNTAFTVAEENIQARLRGLCLMAITNKHGGIVLTTSNKSEAAVGYTTLYGDLAGGFAPLKDVKKTLVYELAGWRNKKAQEQGAGEPIPHTILEKPPSAELAPGQRDDQSLPPYAVLDEILDGYVEHPTFSLQRIADGLVRKGLITTFDEALSTVQRVVRLVDGAEHKRRQSPPGIRITPLAFGRDRRLPITNRWPGSRNVATPRDTRRSAMDKTAVILVDVQGTFADDFPGAGLPVPGAGATVDKIRDFAIQASKDPSVFAIVTSQDWHPEHLPEHMIDPGGTPDFANLIFTRHGIAGTPEAELHPRLCTPEFEAVVTDKVKKGQHAAAFSAFEGVDESRNNLESILRAKGVKRVVVIGWELANCVSATAIDAAKLGFETSIVYELTSVLEPSRLPETLGTLQGWGVETFLTATEAFEYLRDGVPDDRAAARTGQ